MLILEVLLVAIVALVASRVLAQPWKGRFFNALKLYLTVRMVWVLATWPISTEDGGVQPAWQLVLDVIRNIDASTFWTFALIGAAVRFAGVIASMFRWLLVLRGQNIEMPFMHIFGAFLIGRAIGFFLPSTAGLDAYKLYDASRFSGRTVEVTAGTVLEKVLGVTGIFLTFLVALPFGISIFGENAFAVAAITVPMALAIIGGLLTVLWFPGIVQWVIERLPIPGKARLEGIVLRISRATAAYRDKKQLVLMMLGCSFLVHFTTACMYYFLAIAVGAGNLAQFWQIVFGSAIQIFATVIGPTIGGLGVREAAQLLTVGSIIGAGPAILSATLGFWVGEVPTLFGFWYWITRGESYRPAYCRVNGEQVDYEEAARRAIELESEEDRARREAMGPMTDLEPLGQRMLHNAGLGAAAGVFSGVVIGVVESIIIARGGFGAEAQVMWYGPLAYALFLGGLGLLGGLVLGVLPMEREEAKGWTPSLGVLATLVPLGLAITVFRLRRDVYAEQMPPAPVLLGVLAAFGAIALVCFFYGRRIFGNGPLGRVTQPAGAAGLLGAALVGGFIASRVLGPEVPEPGVGAAVPQGLENTPNVILVMVDTLRADHLSCYGASDVQTPNMCSLAKGEGAALDAFSHASWTKPATASLLTSLLPSSHGAMSKPSTLSPDITFVSEALQEHGYATGGIVSNINLAESFGFAQGYDEYHYLGPDYLAGAEESSSKLILYQIVRSVWFKLVPGLRFGDFYQDSEVVNGVAFDWLERHAQSRFFLFLHYMDPHDPYFEHPYNGRAVARVSGEPAEERAEELRDLYVGEIEYLDANFGKLLAKLEALDIANDTMIVLTADHGEEFQEHGGWWHGLTLYDEQIKVPLLVKWGRDGAPADFGGTRTEIARSLDIAPTILARTGARIPETMQGIDLATPPFDRKEKDREVYAEEDHEGNVLWALRTKTMKLIRTNEGNPRGLPTAELFDMAQDPGEQANLAGQGMVEVEARLARNADMQRRAAEGQSFQGEEHEMDLAECEQLKQLGYVDDCSHLQ